MTQQWSPFWRWTALGVLVVLTIAWLAQSADAGSHRPFPAHRRVEMVHQAPALGKGQWSCVPNGDGPGAAGMMGGPFWAGRRSCAAVSSSIGATTGAGSVGVTGAPAGPATELAPVLAREQAQLQQEAAQLQAQEAQLQARLASLQAQLNGLGR